MRNRPANKVDLTGRPSSGSDLRLLRDLESVIYFDAEVPDGGLELRQVISVGGEDIPLPLAVRLTAESRQQSKLAYR